MCERLSSINSRPGCMSLAFLGRVVERQYRDTIIRFGIDPYTPAYYKALREDPRMTFDAITRTKIRHIEYALKGDPDTLTDYFIHEARNVLTVNMIADNDGLATEERELYEGQRQHLLRVLRSFKWFRLNGEIPKREIRTFIQQACLQNWDGQKVQEIYREFQELLRRYESK